MVRITEVVKGLPEMKSGDELMDALTVLPQYDEQIVMESQASRLMALSDLYHVYLPSRMSLEIYSKLYLALLRSLQKKGTKLAVQQQNQNHRAIMQQEYSGILGGSDSFTIIGNSGIGKSSAISRAIALITEDQVIEVDEPYTKIVSCVVVQCPFDSSVKGLMLEILRKVDECLGSNYYENALRARATTDMLIGSVSQVALNHIGLLIVDEIQNVANSKNGRSLVGALTQLINNSGISICMVGTPECTIFFEQAMQLARRSLGLRYGAMEYGAKFQELCRTLFQYQYVKVKSTLSDSMVAWLYEHSGGNVSVVVSLIHDAQELAILNGSETLNLEVLNEAYQKRLSLLHGFIQPKKVNVRSTVQKSAAMPVEQVCESMDDIRIVELAARAKREELDVTVILKEYMAVEEVAV